MDLVLNTQQWLICQKQTNKKQKKQTNQTKPKVQFFPSLIESLSQFLASLFIYQCLVRTGMQTVINLCIVHLYFHKISSHFYFSVFCFSWVNGIFHFFPLFLLSVMRILVTFLVTVKAFFHSKCTFLIIMTLSTTATCIHFTGFFFFVVFI